MIVGKVVNIQRQVSYIDYTLHDTYDKHSIIAREFKEDTQGDTGVQTGALYALEGLVENRTSSGEYVRVYGRLRFFDNQPSIIVFKIKKLESPKELEVHAAEVRVATLFWQKVLVRVRSFSVSFLLFCKDIINRINSGRIDNLKGTALGPVSIDGAFLSSSLL